MDLDPQNNILPSEPLTQTPAKKIRIIIMFSVLILLGGMGVFAYFNLPIKTDKVSEPKIIDQKLNTPQDLGDVNVKYINVKAKLIAAAGGHYLSGENIDYFNSNQDTKLYYDGKVILDSKILGDDGYLENKTMSNNGLHYAFVIAHYPDFPKTPSTALNDLYIDGKKVESIPYQIGSPFITDDGKDYFYTRDNLISSAKKNTFDLIKNGKSIFSYKRIGGINQTLISQDGLTTLLVHGSESLDYYSGATAYSILINNKEIFKTSTSLIGANSMIPYAALSPNGKHYALIKDTKLFIDGVSQLPNFKFIMADVGKLQITNLGHYLISFSDEMTTANPQPKHYLYIDNKEQKFSLESSSKGVSPFLAGYINEDASHFLLHDSNGWALDGKPIDLGTALPYYTAGYFYNKNASVDMEGNTIYIYNFDSTYKETIEVKTTPQDPIVIELIKTEESGKPHSEVTFQGKITNNSKKDIYLNGIGANMDYSELTFDNSPFFQLPAIIKPGESINGVLFKVAISDVALPGKYYITTNIQGGKTNTDYDNILSTIVSIEVK